MKLYVILFLLLSGYTKDVYPASAIEKKCLANAIYFEARGVSESEKELVGEVVLNRVKDSDFPSSICKVVYEKNNFNGKTVYQFSWTKNKNIKILEKKSYEIALDLAERLLLSSNEIDHNYLYFSKRGNSNCKKSRKLCHRFR